MSSNRLDELSRTLGFESYKMYLRGEHWRKFCSNTRTNNCYICNSSKWLHLHHTTYQRLGCELSSDVVTLCKLCHKYVHGQVNKRILDLSNAHEVLKSQGWMPYEKPRKSNKSKKLPGMCRICGQKAKRGKKYCNRHKWDGEINSIRVRESAIKRKERSRKSYRGNDV